TASFSCRACAWRPVRRHDPDPPSRRDPRGRCGGYSRLMGADEEGTLERLKALRREFVDPKIAEHEARIPGASPGTAPTSGGMLVEFPSVADAVLCAVEVQQARRWQ